MNSELFGSLLNVCSILDKHAVEYLVVGGTAVALHGYYRDSTRPNGVVTEKPDLDFWYNPTYRNYFQLLNALKELGAGYCKIQRRASPES